MYVSILKVFSVYCANEECANEEIYVLRFVGVRVFTVEEGNTNME